MATNQITGYGTTFEKWNGSTFEPIGEVTAISWDGATRNTIEIALLNPDDDYINKIQGLINAGSLSVSLGYTKDGFTTLKNDFETRGDQTYQIKFPDGMALEFDGFIGSLPLNFDPAAPIDGEFGIEINGKADFVSATP